MAKEAAAFARISDWLAANECEGVEILAYHARPMQGDHGYEELAYY